MQRITSIGRRLMLVAATAMLVAGCALEAPPSAAQMTDAVQRLDRLLPLIQQLQVSEFERGRCDAIDYGRGAFATPDERCVREGSVPFDAIALADHARVVDALAGTGAPSNQFQVVLALSGEIFTARFVVDNFSVVEWWEYLYDPGDAHAKQNVPGQVEYKPIGDGWWFVISPDD